MAQEATAVALFLSLVMGMAAMHKLVARERLTASTARLLRLSPALAEPIMLAAAAIEMLAAIALLVVSTRPVGALAAALLCAVYAAVLFQANRRGESDLDCGCSFAPASGAASRGLSSFARYRPVALAAVALSIVAMPGVAIGPVSLFAGLALFAFYLAAGELAALPPIARPAAQGGR